jgi:hypothetical protein
MENCQAFFTRLTARLSKNQTIPKLARTITTATAIVGPIIVQIPMSLYDCLWVSPVIPSSVMTAPLCGKVSSQPHEIDAMRIHEQPVVPPQESHFMHVPFRTKVKKPQLGQGSPS